MGADPHRGPETIRRRRADLADQLDQAVTSFERGIKITSFLNDLETIDAVLEFAYDELLGGKTSEVFRNAGGPDQETTNRIVSALRRDPQQTPRSTSGFESGGGLESMISRPSASRTFFRRSNPPTNTSQSRFPPRRSDDTEARARTGDFSWCSMSRRRRRLKARSRSRSRSTGAGIRRGERHRAWVRRTHQRVGALWPFPRGPTRSRPFSC
ncbi:MAG: hypothetical protein R2856_31565 [Caldilineaceae bacterium]